MTFFHRSLPLLCALVLACALLHTARADFEEDDIDDSFSLRVGSASNCPQKIEFDGKFSETTVTSSEMEVNNVQCEGDGQLKLSENVRISDGAGINPTAYFLTNLNEAGDFLAGTMTDDVSCFPAQLRKGEPVVFLKPDSSFTVTYRNLYNATNSVLRGNEFSFNEDAKYVLLADRCIFEETRISDRVCFPAGAMVAMPNGMYKRMAQLQVGDSVVVNEHGDLEPVLSFSHRDAQAKAVFYTLLLQNGASFKASVGHFIPVWHAGTNGTSKGDVIKVDDVKVGDSVMHVRDGLVNVVKVKRSKGTGVWNPHTKSGTIVVDDVVATCYTHATKSALLGHALAAPIRNDIIMGSLARAASLVAAITGWQSPMALTSA